MLSLSRRQLLKHTAITTAFAATPTTLWAAQRPALFIPPLIDVRKGKPIFLKMEASTHQFLPNQSCEVWGFNGLHLGPTIRIQQNSFAKLNYFNNLPQTIALNIQGLQASAELLGGISKKLARGESWSPIIPIKQAAGSCWYHAVSLAHSAYQTYRGLAGFWLIEDEHSRQYALPKKYAVDDIPLILQDISLNKEGIPLFPQNQTALWGNQLAVNGQISPYLNVSQGWLRLRLLNASVSRNYDLSLDNQQAMYLIAQDQGFLPQAKKIQQLSLAPSERAEVLIYLDQTTPVRLIHGKTRHFFNKITTLFSEQQLLDNTVLEIRPQGLSAVFSQKNLPHFHNDIESTLKQPIRQERQFHFDANSGLINDQHFDPKRITQVKRGSMERWQLTSNAPIGFKIQGAKFIVESINEVALNRQDQVWKDSVWIDKKVNILVRFDNSSSNNHPFIFGTSNLMLADKGCFRLLVVQ